MRRHIISPLIVSLTFIAQAASTNVTLAQLLNGLPQFSILYNYLHQAAILDSLNTYAGNLTIVAPTNDAFQSLFNSPTGSALFAGPAKVPRDVDMFRAIMQYHAVRGLGPANNANTTTGTFYETLLDNPTYELVSGGQWIRFVKGNENATWYFAENQQSNVTGESLSYSNGIVYPVDTVMIPPYNLSRTTTDLGLSAFAGALAATNLTTAFDQYTSRPAITVLAPLNSGFAAISSSLAALSAQQLSQILAYHVLPIRQIVAIPADAASAGGSTFLNGTSVTTVVVSDVNGTARVAGTGGQIHVTVDANGDTFLNNARVVSANIPIENGLLHVIDQVLNPNAEDVVNSTATAGMVAYPSATSTSGVPFATYATQPTTTVALVPAPSATTGAAVSLRKDGLAAAAAAIAGAVAILAA